MNREWRSKTLPFIETHLCLKSITSMNVWHLNAPQPIRHTFCFCFHCYSPLSEVDWSCHETKEPGLKELGLSSGHSRRTQTCLMTRRLLLQSLSLNGDEVGLSASSVADLDADWQLVWERTLTMAGILKEVCTRMGEGYLKCIRDEVGVGINVPTAVFDMGSIRG